MNSVSRVSVVLTLIFFWRKNMSTKNTVKIGNKTYPIKCNIEVLMEIQDEYDSISLFEMDILGFKLAHNVDGSVKRDDEGKPVLRKTEPKLSAIYKILPIMLKAGAKSDAEIPEISKDKINFDYIAVATAMHNEFERCFERKNQ